MIVVVGDVVTDVVAAYEGVLAAGSDTAARIRTLGGGSAANTAAWLATLGAPVRMIGVVGADDAGRTRAAELRALGVETFLRSTEEAATGSIVVLSDGRERTMLSDRGANGLLRPADLALDGVRHLHLSGYTLFDPATREAGLRALAEARARGATTSVDASSAAPLRRVPFLSFLGNVDVLLANVDEARVLLGTLGTAPDLAPALLTRVRHAIVKSGADGAVWAHADGVVSAPAAPVPAVVDPTGAGDAFAAGLLHAWLGGAPPSDALARGAQCGARAVTKLGGRP
ncbi:ribokinase [Virgisporangium aliadipatigenens]|uniref:Ribokinase n=1 Tax=Virgisporangium aliadipatigenens TaxID=741659 RepID=A0A8J3YXF7_9ACTN|nr:PfkB family carbohydrate kinase [Virgisporangium aliadipatigenens]GIJ52413.1 ribokinase [Virgisporangium aliadipatigenens]